MNANMVGYTDLKFFEHVKILVMSPKYWNLIPDATLVNISTGLPASPILLKRITFIHYLPNEVKPNINMFLPRMVYLVLCEFNSTLTIVMNIYMFLEDAQVI